MKVEYDDLYKFLVSVGVILVFLSLFLPWILLKEPFDLLVESGDLGKLAVEAQASIGARQQILLWATTYVPYVSFFSATLGLVTIIVGFCKWRARQRLLDRLLEQTVEAQRRKLELLTPREIKEKAREEIKEEAAEPPVPWRQSIRNYLQIERTLIGKLSECLADGYTAFPHRSAGAARFDLVMQQRSPTPTDLVCEIKYRSTHFSRLIESETIIKLVDYAKQYIAVTGRDSIPVLLYVMPESLLTKVKVSEYIDEAEWRSAERSSDVRVAFIREERLAMLDCAEVRGMLDV